MGYATIRPTQPLGTYVPMMGMIAATSTSPAWLDGAALAVTSGLLVEATTANIGGLVTASGLVQSTVAATLWGFSASAFTLAITASGGSAIGTESQRAVGAGSAITGVRRSFYPINRQLLWFGSIDTSGSQGATALSVTDIGGAPGTSLFSLATVNASGAITTGSFWIVNRTTGTNTGAVVVTRLIDPPGAKFGDTPIPGVDTGQALVEFMVVPAAWAI